MQDKKRSRQRSNQTPPRRSATSGSAITEDQTKDYSKMHVPSHRSGGETRSRSKSRGRESAPSKSSTAGDSRSKSRQRSSHTSKNPKSTKNGTTKSRDNNDSKVAASNGKRSSAADFNSKKRRQKFSAQATKLIPANVRMISGSHDSQTSADVSNIGSSFALPNPCGRAGGACTAALLEVLYQYDEGKDEPVSWVHLLREMRQVLKSRGYDQIPQLTSSKIIDLHDPFLITPPSFNSKRNHKRAVLVGINYTGQKGQLSGCHNDVLNISKYLKDVHGFKKSNVTILMDDGHHKSPTKNEIMKAYKKVVKESEDGDVVFCHYSGHGGHLKDISGDEEDGHDETLIPIDYERAGQIRDDDLLKVLVHPMPPGVTMTCVMDCCHSGTVLDLPYRFTADGDVEEMEINERVNFSDALWTGMGIASGAAAGTAAVSAAASALTSGAPEMMILGGGPNAIHEYSDSSCCVIT